MPLKHKRPPEPFRLRHKPRRPHKLRKLRIRHRRRVHVKRVHMRLPHRPLPIGRETLPVLRPHQKRPPVQLHHSINGPSPHNPSLHAHPLGNRQFIRPRLARHAARIDPHHVERIAHGRFTVFTSAFARSAST
jgi:hypothetical protein